MNKILLTLAAGLAFANAAQAELYSARYTATITTIVDGDSAQPLSSGTVQGNVIRMGDTVTGWYTFDSSEQGYVHDYGGWIQGEYGFNDAISSVVRFDNSGYTETSSRGSDFFHVDTSEDGGDSLRMVGRKYSNDPDYIATSEITFKGLKGTFAEPGMIPMNAFTLPGWEFSFDLMSFDPNTKPVTFSGAITSMSLIAVVPEPSTYAMFAAGLGLLAWRRKRG